MIPEFTRIATVDPVLSRLQDVLERVLREFTRRIDNDSVTVSSTAIDTAAAGTTLTHGLNRTPQGWEIIDLDADANVWRLSWTSTTITLIASAAVNAAIKVW